MILNINQFNSDVYTKQLVNCYMNKNIINFDKDEKKDITNIIFEKIEDKNNYKFLNKCYIIHYKIIDMINNISKNNKKYISIYKKTAFSKFNNIYIYDKNSIIIGSIEQKIFIPKYILSFDSLKILEEEEEKLLLTYKEIENYLIFRNYKKSMLK